ncbi:MAG: KAP family NTPase [Candidatus Thiodiazotropha sp. (ex Lucinoma borealis)]|nr:KAP family NTPase [Candidatus Thiodiazotropha sp. (ex Lucinoma borealis)]
MDFTIKINTPWEDPEDLLDRRKYADLLTKYLEGLDIPFVLNVNAGWGFGKTYFLRNWAESIENHPVVYINAWENDFSDDPLITILNSINNELASHLDDNQEAKLAIKELCKLGGRFLKKSASIITKSAINKALGPDAVDDLKQLNIAEFAEKSTEFLLEDHNDNSKNMTEFRESLKELVKSITKNSGDLSLPAFIFIDELDRCRPTYAIELLENIKHLFSVQGTVYVIATDSAQLQHSIRAVYGEGFNGVEYLRRFFDREFMLPDPSYMQIAQMLSQKFTAYDKFANTPFKPFHRNGRENKPENNESCNALDWWFDFYASSFKVPTRTLIQCYMQFDLIINSTDEIWHLPFLLYLVFLYSCDRNLFDEIKKHTQGGVQVPDKNFYMPLSKESVRWLYHESIAPKIESVNIYMTASNIGETYINTIISNRWKNPNTINQHAHYRNTLVNLILISLHYQTLPDTTNHEVDFLEYFSAIETSGYLK